ncbi:MAG: hypothetical protein Tsb005_19280 [Gammaproteobacteria bacterium]
MDSDKITNTLTQFTLIESLQNNLQQVWDYHLQILARKPNYQRSSQQVLQKLSNAIVNSDELDAISYCDVIKHALSPISIVRHRYLLGLKKDITRLLSYQSLVVLMQQHIETLTQLNKLQQLEIHYGKKQLDRYRYEQMHEVDETQCAKRLLQQAQQRIKKLEQVNSELFCLIKTGGYHVDFNSSQK